MDQIIKKNLKALDVLSDLADQHLGFFPSIIDLKNNQMRTDMPPCIEGQRPGDRSHFGSNLMDDQTILKLMYQTGILFDRPRDIEVADRYLKNFVLNCTHTATGLFPWGEHAYWNLIENKADGSTKFVNPELSDIVIHEHIYQAPEWLWKKMCSFDRKCLYRFANGLKYHWSSYEPQEYIRHARVDEKIYPGPEPGKCSCDFPRHSGLYIFDWSLAYQYYQDESFIDEINKIIDYWWRFHDEDGLLLMESRSYENRFININSVNQTLSLGINLLEASVFVEKLNPELSQSMQEKALTYINGFLNAPHDIENKIFVLRCSRPDKKIHQTSQIWGSKYGGSIAAPVAVNALHAYKLTNIGALLDWSIAVGQCYCEESFPKTYQLPVRDVGLALELLGGLYEVTKDKKWLTRGIEMADEAIDSFWTENLPRGALNLDYYESQLAPAFLLHATMRLALLERSATEIPLTANTIVR